MSREWGNGLFSCFEDMTTCLLAFFAPCYLLGKNAEQLGESCLLYGFSIFLPILQCYFPYLLRKKITEQKGIEATGSKDFFISLFCLQCALVQETRELQAPGGESMARE